MIKKHPILVLFLLWSLWISFEFLLGPYSHVRIHDAGDGFLPQAIAAKIQFEKYGPSYFAPYMASGVDASAQILIPFANINSLLFTIFPGYVALGVLMFLQRLIASYFTYKLAREILKIDFWPSVIAALIFSLFNFSIFSFTFYHNGLTIVPLALYLLEKLLKKSLRQSIIYIALAGLLYGYITSFVYSTIYLMPFIFFWFFLIRKQQNLKALVQLLSFAFFTILIQFPNIYATIINSKLSQRTIWDLSIATGPQGLFKLALGDLTGRIWANIVSLTVILLSAQYQKKWLVAASMILVIPTITKYSQVYIPQELGVIRTFSFERFDILTPFVLALIAAICTKLILTKVKPIFKLSLVSCILAVIVLGSFKIKLETLLNYAPYRNLYMHPQLVDLSQKVDSSQYRVVTITGGGARSSYPLAYGLHTVDSYITLYPKTYHDYWQKVIAKRIQDDKLRYDDFVKWGNRIYLYGPKNFYDLENIEFQKYYDLDLLSYANVKYIISQKPVADPALTLLESKYREEINNWNQKSKLQKLAAFINGKYYGPALYIYENNKVLPRFFIEKDGSLIKEEVKVIKYSPDFIELSTEADQNSYLVASINYYPWWKAKINGQDVEIEKYKGTFVSLNIPKGHNQIIFEYLPPYKI